MLVHRVQKRQFYGIPFTFISSLYNDDDDNYYCYTIVKTTDELLLLLYNCKDC